jgi:hypothetical protein
MSISYLKIRIFVRDQGKTETQPAGILQYVEDLRRRFNTDIGKKDFSEMVSIKRIQYRVGVECRTTLYRQV